MKPQVYNACLAAGLVLTTAGVACESVPLALIVCGVSLVGLTLTSAFLTRRR